MKNIKTICFLVLSVVTLFSCSYEPEIHSRITIYPLLTLNGPAEVIVSQAGSYADPGAVSTENGVVIPNTTHFVGKYRGASGATLDTSIPDEYTQTYTAVNKDGFPGTVTRKVIVANTGDLVSSIEGVYVSTVKRDGALLPSTQGSSVNMKYVYIWKNADGKYEVSDALGGWYDLGRKIGVTSACKNGKIIAGNIATNSFTFEVSSANEYFGSVATLTNLTVSATTKNLVLTSTWSGYTFVSTLVQL